MGNKKNLPERGALILSTYPIIKWRFDLNFRMTLQLRSSTSNMKRRECKTDWGGRGEKKNSFNILEYLRK